jgi:hypothetical protein
VAKRPLGLLNQGVTSPRPSPAARLSRRLGPWLCAGLLLTGCKAKPDDGATQVPEQFAAGVQKITIEPAPEHLRGRVALSAGARLYARPTYTSPSWELILPDPPLSTTEAPPRVRAFRVVGVVRSLDGSLGGAPTEFLAITNDLAGDEDEPPGGCGPAFRDLEHLRMLFYVPTVHLAEVTTRTLELQPFSASGAKEEVRVGAGTRVGPPGPSGGLPSAPPGSSWRWIDADGIRVLAPIPDDAVGHAWDPADAPEPRTTGEQLMQDAEGSMLWLHDDGGATVELSVRNACGEDLRVVEDASEVESLRALAMDVFYDQSPPPEPATVQQPNADYLITAGTPLRWTDGELAGEVLRDWGVAVGVGQTWDDRRCFPLELSGELHALDGAAIACVKPEALEPLAGAGSFAVSDELELGGSIELGPPEVVAGEWTASLLRPVLNSHHETVAECLRPMLVADEDPAPSRWVLELIVTADGHVDQVELTALADTHPAVEDCLRAEAFTWLMPEGGGQVLVPVTLGPWGEGADEGGYEDESPSPESGPVDEERGKVIIIRDEEE